MSPVPVRSESRLRTSWVRGQLEPEEAWLAGALALAAGAVVGGTVLYLARTFLAREEFHLRPGAEEEGSRG